MLSFNSFYSRLFALIFFCILFFAPWRNLKNCFYGHLSWIQKHEIMDIKNKIERRENNSKRKQPRKPSGDKTIECFYYFYFLLFIRLFFASFSLFYYFYSSDIRQAYCDGAENSSEPMLVDNYTTRNNSCHHPAAINLYLILFCCFSKYHASKVQQMNSFFWAIECNKQLKNKQRTRWTWLYFEILSQYSRDNMQKMLVAMNKIRRANRPLRS